MAFVRIGLGLLAGVCLAACTEGEGTTGPGMAMMASASPPTVEVADVAATSPSTGSDDDARVQGGDTAWPKVLVHKSPTCGCCTLWVDHLVEAGFDVETRDHAPDALNALKLGLGVPYGKGSCHTAQVGGYFVEGHVPAGDIKRMLSDRIDARGLVLPGMPMGSPGMEMPDGRTTPYAVESVHADGSTTVYMQH